MIYTPDRWVVLDITIKEGTHQRVFAGWIGGFVNGDSWKMNSGITKVEEFPDYYDFYGESGSIYTCFKEFYGLTFYMESVLRSFQETPEVTIAVSPMYQPERNKDEQ
jgi:hypothetical protein